MDLYDLKRLAVRRRIRIGFRTSDGVECSVDEHGVARVPGLKGVPAFSLSQENAPEEYWIETSGRGKNGPEPISRASLELLCAERPAADTQHDHDE